MVHGQRVSKSFSTKTEAQRWSLRQEAEGKQAPAQKMLVEDALKRLLDEHVNAGKSRGDIARVKRLMLDPIAEVRIPEVSKDHLIRYRDARLQEVSEASVRREMNELRGLFRRCREEWGWMTHNPFEGFAAPKSPESRKRRLTEDEIERVRQAFGVGYELRAESLANRVGLCFLFAIETAMRSGEIVGLTWNHVHLDKRYVHIPITKNGDKRDVPLSTFAAEILQALPRDGDQPCFGMNDAQRDAIWRKYRDRAAVEDLHFHDTRAEGIWRLSKKLDVLQLARVIGHRDIKSLLIYYRESATDMAAKLG